MLRSILRLRREKKEFVARKCEVKGKYTELEKILRDREAESSTREKIHDQLIEGAKTIFEAFHGSGRLILDNLARSA